MDDFDREKVDETVLALMYLTLHDWNRAWKGFDWNKAKSVVLTDEGLAKSASLFERYFGKSSETQDEP